MVALTTTSQSKLSIGPISPEATSTVSEYEALTPYTLIKKVEDLGELGDTSNEVTGVAIEDGRVRKAKGARNAGTMAVITFRQYDDPGQLAAIAAEKTKERYAFKLEVADVDAPGTGTVLYFSALVGSRAERYGTADNITRRVFNLWVDSPVTEDPAAPGP